MTAKSDIEPQFVRRETLAKLLNVSVSTIDDYAARDILPQPSMLGTLRLWYWPALKATLLDGGDESPATPEELELEEELNAAREIANG